MKIFTLLMVLALTSTPLFAKKISKDLTIDQSSYIVSEHQVRLFHNGKMHINIFQWICEVHPNLIKFRDKYDSIRSFEVFIKNDCSKRCQLVVITFKDGQRQQTQVNNYLVYIRPDAESLTGFSNKTSGVLVKENVLAKMPLIFSDEVTLASKSW